MTSRLPPDPAPSVAAGLAVRSEGLVPPRDTEVTRRTALKLFSATALLTGAGACTRQPERKVVSLAETPEYRRPGVPLHYASTWSEAGWPYGILVKSVDGRPVKVEGLPDHPLNRGGTSAAMQATLLSLYDPERLRAPRVDGKEATWAAADAAVTDALRSARSVLLLTRASLGPSERALVARWAALQPGFRHLAWEAVSDAPARAAWKAVYGAEGIVVPDLAAARIVVTLDCDLFGAEGEALGAIRDFAARRRVDDEGGAARMNRLYAAESTMTVTGSNADHRIPLRPSDALAFLDALRLAVEDDAAPLDALAARAHLDREVLGALAEDVRAHRGEIVLVVGSHLPASVHALAAVLHGAWGCEGKTVRWVADPPTLPAAPAAEVLAALDASPDVVLCLGVNPVHDGPPGTAERLRKAKLSVGHGLTLDETLSACRIALPSAHALECWNDAAPVPGVVGLAQPMIAPLFGGRQEAESLLRWAKALWPDDTAWKAAADWHDVVKYRTQVAGPGPDAEAAWEAALRRGFAGSPRPSRFPSADRAPAADLVARERAALEAGGEGYDVVLRPHPAMLDGRFAGNAWLHECPDPVSRTVWDNAAAVGPRTAERLGVREGDWIRVAVGDRALEVPVLVQPGAAPGVVTLTLGYGRTAGAGVGDGVGYNAAPLLGGGVTPRLHVGAKVAKASRARRPFVRTQGSFDMHGRPIVLDGTREEYVSDPAFVRGRVHVPPLEQLHEAWDYSQGPKWEMAIDLSACVGCNACVIACQAENNVPVVGRDECGVGREMHWMRIDRYEVGDPENPKTLQQPMLCQHCDNAPCESVCPVNATSHSPDGLNEQTYNRCVGTRYCANNCPYKVRRFNFFNYTKEAADDPVRDLLYNPQVTVRSRGVMEKCTFCLQRINAAKFAASNAGTPLADGAVVTACQQACPAGAIVFGDRNAKDSRVARKRASPLGYRVLEETNVRPNVTYLARVRNPHPRLAARGGEGGHR